VRRKPRLRSFGDSVRGHFEPIGRAAGTAVWDTKLRVDPGLAGVAQPGSEQSAAARVTVESR